MIEVQNEFSRDWIKGCYEKLITETIYDITEKQYKLEIVTNHELETNNDLPSQSSIQRESIESKLDMILAELKQMNQRISDLETKIQHI